MQTTIAKVTDTNHRPAGMQTIAVQLHQGRPFRIDHKGASYFFRGKTGTNRATGEAVWELATERDARLWANADASKVWED